MMQPEGLIVPGTSLCDGEKLWTSAYFGLSYPDGSIGTARNFDFGSCVRLKLLHIVVPIVLQSICLPMGPQNLWWYISVPSNYAGNVTRRLRQKDPPNAKQQILYYQKVRVFNKN